MEESEDKVTLIANNQEKHTVAKKAASLSVLIKNHLSDFSTDQPIPLEEVDEETLKLVIEFLTVHNGIVPSEIEHPLKHKDLKDVVDEKSYKVINKASTLEQLIDLVNAANYMEIKSLLEAGCAAIAIRCQDKSEHDILQDFGVTCVINEHERQRIIDENKWIEENFSNY